jgi:ATP-dependent Clp protease ATP-binding subunit ClpB
MTLSSLSCDSGVPVCGYIADHFLPDKASLIDEAAAKLKMEITSKPLAPRGLDRRINCGWNGAIQYKAAKTDKAAAQRLSGPGPGMEVLRASQEADSWWVSVIDS